MLRCCNFFCFYGVSLTAALLPSRLRFAPAFAGRKPAPQARGQPAAASVAGFAAAAVPCAPAGAIRACTLCALRFAVLRCCAADITRGTQPFPPPPAPPTPYNAIGKGRNVATWFKVAPILNLTGFLFTSANLDARVNDNDLVATLFIPSDAAWEAWLKAADLSAAELLANAPLAAKLARNHFVPGVALRLLDMNSGDKLATLGQGALTVRPVADDTKWWVVSGRSTAMIVLPDLVADNAIVHVIVRAPPRCCLLAFAHALTARLPAGHCPDARLGARGPAIDVPPLQSMNVTLSLSLSRPPSSVPCCSSRCCSLQRAFRERKHPAPL